MTQPQPLSYQNAPSHIVGIGASAGGIEALETFFTQMPNNSGAAFVVIQHLSPNHESVMHVLLARITQMPIRTIEDGDRPVANTIYLNSPRSNIVLRNGRFAITTASADNKVNFPIDAFFQSLAEELGPRAILVVLSGAGSDGSNALTAGGDIGSFILAQSKSSAAFDGMPGSAIATGLPDFILSPDKMPERILAYMNNSSNNDPSLSQEEPDHFVFDDSDRLAQSTAYDAVARSTDAQNIYGLLHRRYYIDFTQYKASTIVRRLQRRMQLAQHDDLGSYLEHLRRNNDEVERLFNDLLIGVTQFFRDPAAFRVLEERVVPDLIAQTPANGEIRVWVAGCASGEEAYSIAMILDEQIQNQNKPVTARIFGTDIHQPLVDQAMTGIYSAERLTYVSSERQARYFVPVKDGYQVVKDLRRRVVFAQQDLIQDAGFARLDLVTCRNMLIYLSVAAQRKALVRLSSGLRAGGYLMLGPSESIDNVADAFEEINYQWRLYRKIDEVPASPLDLPVRMHHRAPKGILRSQSNSPAGSHEQAWMEDVLVQCMPTGLLLDSSYDIIYILGDANRFLEIPTGRTTPNALDMIASDLQIPLRAALYRAGATGEEVSLPRVALANLPTVKDADAIDVDVTVLPLTDARNETLRYFVKLKACEQTELRPVDEGETSNHLKQQYEAKIEALERELELTRESLQATIQEQDTANEELIASNEEIQSANEELSATNEELYSVNVEFQRTIQELRETNTDLRNLQNSTQIGVIFLDSNLSIRTFTPSIGESLNLLQQDRGRPLAHLAYNLTIEFEQIEDAARHVLAGGKGVDLQTTARDGTTYLLRVLPYLSEASEVEGVILTFIDISERIASERALEASQNLLQTIVDHQSDSIVRFKVEDQTITFVNRTFCEKIGKKRDELVGLSSSDLRPEEIYDSRGETIASVIRTGETHVTERLVYMRSVDEERWLQWTDIPIRDDSGSVVEIQTVIQDITARKKLETLEIERQTQQYFDVMAGVIYVLDAKGTITRINPAGAELLGYGVEELVGRNCFDTLWTEGTRAAKKKLYRQIIAGEAEPAQLDEITLLTKSGERLTILRKMEVIRNAEGQVTGTITSGYDVSDRKRIETALAQSEARYRTVVDSQFERVWRYDVQDLTLTFVNEAFCRYWNKSEEELLGAKVSSLSDSIDDESLRQLVRELCTSKKSRSFESETVSPVDGSVGWSSWTDIPVANERGEVVEIQCVARDITQRKKAEIALVETTHMLRTIADNLPAWIAYLDNEYRFHFANRYYEIATGVSVDEMVGQLAQDVLPPESFTKSQPYYERALSGETTYYERWTRSKAHGGEAYVGLSFIPNWVNGEVKGVFLLGVDITEVKKAEVALEESRRMLNSIIQAMPTALFIYDLNEERNVYNNERLESLTGYTLDEVKTMGNQFLPTIMHPDDLARQPEYHEQLAKLAAGESLSQEYRMQHKDGSWHWVLTHDVVFKRNQDGSIAQLVGTALDITEGKLLEQEREEHARFIQAIAEADPNIIYVFDLNEQHMLYLNRDFGSELGYSAEEVEAMGSDFIPSVVHPDDIPQLEEYYERFANIRPGEVLQRESRVRHKSGEWRWLLSYETIFRSNEDGSVAEILGSTIDITNQKKVQQRLDDSNRLLRLVTDHLPARVSYLDADLHVQFANRIYSELFGISQEECIGLHIESIIGKKRFQIVKEHLGHAASGELVTFESHTDPLPGGRFEYEQSTYVPDVHDGEIRGYFAMTVDITPMKRAQEEISTLNVELQKANATLEERVRMRTRELEEMNSDLRRINEELDRFVYIASHDLKEPLRGIRSYLDALTEDHGHRLHDEGRVLVRQVTTLADRAQQLIEDLRLYSSIGRKDRENLTVDLDGVVRRVRTILEPLISREKVVIRKTQELPVVQYNPSHILTIFQNLIANGIKYNESEEKIIEVGFIVDATGEERKEEPREGQDPPSVVFFVRDNGIGIPQRHHKRIFEMFKRLHPEHRYGGGTGAGLALVKKIIEQNGGKIWLESTPRKGTTFYFQL